MLRFAEKLRALREQHKLSQRGLAKVFDMSQSHLHLLETGQRQPTVAFVVKVAQFFAVTPDHLLLDEVELPE